MMNQDNPYAMNQTCKVCGEPAAGFHFGAFTCEGCKSFFGRSYNNLSSIADCKNNGECIINKKNRTACKACRLRKCILVGMSKSGSRYGRRSNWFKIHCLLQEQQQQQQAALAAHHSQQQHQHQHQHQHQQHQQQLQQQQQQHQAGQHPSGALGGLCQKPPPAAAAALGMLGHHAGAAAAAAAAAAAYPGLFPPRTKEELIMLGLEEYAAAKHSAAAIASSPSVSSPESHNSDSSVEVNVRTNQLLHLSGKHATAAALEAVGAPQSQLRKDLPPPFLPLHFPAGLASMPVMPPPAFLPPSHLLFPGYHPALYPHHQGLLKPLPEQQQQAAAAAAMQQLFASSNVGSAGAAIIGSGAGTTTTTNMTANRYAQAHSVLQPPPRHSPNRLVHLKEEQQQQKIAAESLAATSLISTASVARASPTQNSSGSSSNNNNNNNNNNNHLPNGGKVGEEFSSTRFYLDAILNSDRGRSSSPSAAAALTPASTKLPAPKHDHSISALFTPKSEAGTRERPKSRRQSNNNDDDADADDDADDADDVDDCEEAEDGRKLALRPPNGEGAAESDCGEDLVVSMTPPRSPAAVKVAGGGTHAQDDPIDLSMKPLLACGERAASESCCDNSFGSSSDIKASKACVALSSSTSPPRGEMSNDPKVDGEAPEIKFEADEVATDDNEEEVDEGEGEGEEDEDEDDGMSTVETVKSAIQNNINFNINNNNNNNNNNNSCSSNNKISCKKRRQSIDGETSSDGENVDSSKRKLSKIVELVESEVERVESKCVKLLLDAENINNNVEQKLLRKLSPLDLTTKV